MIKALHVNNRNSTIHLLLPFAYIQVSTVNFGINNSVQLHILISEVHLNLAIF